MRFLSSSKILLALFLALMLMLPAGIVNIGNPQTVHAQQIATPEQLTFTTTSGGLQRHGDAWIFADPGVTISDKGPYLDKVIIRYIPSPAAAIEALRAGEVDDLTHFLAPTTLIALNASPIVAKAVPATITGTIMLNTPGALTLGPECCPGAPGNQEAIGDARFRKALLYAWGDGSWVKDITLFTFNVEPGGLGKVYGPFYNDKIPVLTQNFDAANKILDDAGYKKSPDGFRTTPSGKQISLNLLYPAETPNDQLIALGWRSQLQKIGIKLNPVASDFATNVAANIARKFDFDIIEGYWMNPSPDYPLGFYYTDTRNVFYFGGVGDNPKLGGTGTLDTTLDAGRLAPTEDAALQNLKKAQELIYQAGDNFQYEYINDITPFRTDRLTGWVATTGPGVWFNFWNFINLRNKDGTLGGQHVQGNSVEPTTDNPFVASYVHPEEAVFGGASKGLVYEGLFHFEAPFQNLVWVPNLGTSFDIKVTDKGTDVTVKLRQGVKWHDGKPFNADDVVFTLNTMASKGQSIYKSRLVTGAFDSAEKIDDFTVVAHFKAKSPTVLHFLSFTPIVPKHKWETIADPASYVDPQPIGTGPFKFVQWKRGEFTELAKNTDYWNLPPVFAGNRWKALPAAASPTETPTPAATPTPTPTPTQTATTPAATPKPTASPTPTSQPAAVAADNTLLIGVVIAIIVIVVAAVVGLTVVRRRRKPST